MCASPDRDAGAAIRAGSLERRAAQAACTSYRAVRRAVRERGQPIGGRVCERERRVRTRVDERDRLPEHLLRPPPRTAAHVRPRGLPLVAHPEVAHRPEHAEPLEPLTDFRARFAHERRTEEVRERGGGRDGLVCRCGEGERACGKTRREVVVHDQRPHHLHLPLRVSLAAVLAGVAEDRQPRAAALVRDDDEAGARLERRDARALGGGVHVAALRDEVGVYECRREAERGERGAEDEPCAEPVGVLVGEEQSRLARGGAAGCVWALVRLGEGGNGVPFAEEGARGGHGVLAYRPVCPGVFVTVAICV